ncbi:hypothetical protein [Spirosoma agri]|uniref:Uncharacterized protein n=1 Tax=Spirosoma agri TaxID=1987381 RepID=A0A6M0IFZ9_9BACT|nr:hypothetical protein [Spirosoma agri]NEU67078.1 hypothetical protein [Spirosoma agri]
MAQNRKEIDLSARDLQENNKDSKSLSDILKHIDEWIWSRSHKKGKSQTFPFAFQVTDSQITKINKRIESLFMKFKDISTNDIFFNGEVRFQDISTTTFDDLNELLDRAGDKKDPEKVTLKWHVFIKELLSNAEIIIEFNTEKPLLNESPQWFKYHVASMRIDVYSPASDWNELVFDELTPFVHTLKLAGMYKPLLMFKEKIVVDLFSYTIGVIAWTIFNQFQTIYKDNLKSINDNKSISRILEQKTIENKFSEFIKIYFNHKPIDSITDAIFSVGVGLTIFYTTYIVSTSLLPKLVPKSGINIGLSKHRYDNWENGFKLGIFTFLISGILLPIIRKLFGI